MNGLAANPVTETPGGVSQVASIRPSKNTSPSDSVASAIFSSQSNTPKFTVDGNAGLEDHLEALCADVRAGVQSIVPQPKLAGLILAGGYGRGEGGVLRTESGGQQPYNDLEFYVFARGSALLAETKFRGPLHELGHRLSAKAGIEVEFKVLTSSKLRTAPPSMFFYDLVARHRVIIGDEELLAGCQHHCEARSIPLSEATRLLMNRCSGLLFSAERLQRSQFGAVESDFVGRNLAKAQLALGDVLLTARGRYHWSCRERHKRLLALQHFGNESWHESIRGHHAAGVEFKLHPVRSNESREALEFRHSELKGIARRLWVWLENARLETAYGSPQDYARGCEDKCPETNAFRNRLVNAKAFGPVSVFATGGSRHPRQRLLHALCLLLWNADSLGSGPLLTAVQQELRSPASDFPGLVSAYESLWHRFN